MIYLVDANVLSEVTKPAPHVKVLEWLRAHEGDIAVDPFILGEIRFGIHLRPAGSHRRQLERWFVHVIEKIRCLAWNANTGLCWAKLLADLRVTGAAMPIKDSLIAATALTYGLTVATRNTKDFAKAGVKLFDPFAG